MLSDRLWDRLEEVCDLWEHSRHKAACAAWRELPTDFRSRVLRFVLGILTEGDVEAYPEIECTSRYGKVTMGPSLFNRLTRVIPQVNRRA